MPLPLDVASIAGAQELYDWFGYWPEFHDAEILSFHLDLGVPSNMVIHTWEMTNQVNEAGFYGSTKGVVVAFTLVGVTSLNLQNPWEHSTLFDLGINKTETGFRLELSSSYGLSGTIEVKELSLRITPGKPSPKTALSS